MQTFYKGLIVDDLRVRGHLIEGHDLGRWALVFFASPKEFLHGDFGGEFFHNDSHLGNVATTGCRSGEPGIIGDLRMSIGRTQSSEL